jgi:hypothetical protein
VAAAGGDGGAVAYRVEVAEGSGSFEAVYSGDATECTAKKLSPGCRYRVRVQALGRAGPGPYCPEESFRTLPAAEWGGWGAVWAVACDARVQMLLLALLVAALFLWFGPGQPAAFGRAGRGRR